VTWTYDGTPGTSSAAERRDAVRVLVGDTDVNEQRITDEEITFFLSQGGDDVYRASAVACRALAAKYAHLVDVDVDSGGLSAKYSQRSAAYEVRARQLETLAKKYGDVGLGVPLVGGLSRSEMQSVESDTDRFDSVFSVNSLLRSVDDDELER